MRSKASNTAVSASAVMVYTPTGSPSNDSVLPVREISSSSFDKSSTGSSTASIDGSSIGSSVDGGTASASTLHESYAGWKCTSSVYATGVGV